MVGGGWRGAMAGRSTVSCGPPEGRLGLNSAEGRRGHSAPIGA